MHPTTHIANKKYNIVLGPFAFCCFCSACDAVNKIKFFIVFYAAMQQDVFLENEIYRILTKCKQPIWIYILLLTLLHKSYFVELV